MKITVRINDDIAQKLDAAFENYHIKFKTKNDFYNHILESFFHQYLIFYRRLLKQYVKKLSIKT